MKFGFIKESVKKAENLWLFSPDILSRIQLLEKRIAVKVQSSNNDFFTDIVYNKSNIEVSSDISDCDLLFGSEEILLESFIPNKSYLIFSETGKNFENSRKLLADLAEKNIELYEVAFPIKTQNSLKVHSGLDIGFIGAYNSFRAFGIKFELFKLPKIESFSGKEDLVKHLKRLVLPPIKIVVTGSEIVGKGIKEILAAIKIKEVSVDNYLSKNYTQAVFVQIGISDYYTRKDGQVPTITDYIQNPLEYVSNFDRFTKVSDIFIAGHFHADDRPIILTNEMLKAKDCKIKVVGCVSSDVNNGLACNLRLSTKEEPFYGYLPIDHKEVDVFHPAAIVVMAIDNAAYAVEAKLIHDFTEVFAKHIIPHFLNGAKDETLERSKIMVDGKFTTRFKYLYEENDN
jgi:hypothetical protein